MQDHQANVKKDDCVCIISLSFDFIAPLCKNQRARLSTMWTLS